jgi:hypothetical protein
VAPAPPSGDPAGGSEDPVAGGGPPPPGDPSSPSLITRIGAFTTTGPI